MAFLMVTDGEGLTGRIRSMMEMPETAAGDEQKCRLMIMDIPDNGGWCATYSHPRPNPNHHLTLTAQPKVRRALGGELRYGCGAGLRG